ncbi:hypothetical protein BDP55DRAFT_727150 [Colletotrichum godetiae]|uniref:Uncharacterized protein n=1 Tax=Colletotrichum godetiae TaxID=1209918 RepID=A0AAJ0EUK7_9PEZI|nr:uncharacterized protein BDP55DRAFT_727150 [Colletotrichum godetiae]KAK1687744.1 hypothetical protein BDP55DRAFT_727150 [Colletotrichum godetiae]
MCWEKQIIYTDCHHSVFENVYCADHKSRKLNYVSSFTSSSVNSIQNHNRARQKRKNPSWIFLLCPCFTCPSTPPPQAHESFKSSTCRGRKRCLSPVGGKCLRCVQEKAVAAMQAVPSTPAPSRTRQHHHQRQQQQRRPDLRGTGRNDAYGAPGDRGPKASRPREHVRRYQDPGTPERPRSGRDGNETNLQPHRGSISDFTRPAHGKPPSSIVEERTKGPINPTIIISNGRKSSGYRGPTSHPPPQPSPIPSCVRESTFHLLPAPLKIKKKTIKQETSLRAAKGTAEGTGGLTRSTTHASRPLQVNATHETGEARSSRDQQQEDHHRRAVVSSSPEPRIEGAGWTPELPLEELMDEVEMLWRRVPN